MEIESVIDRLKKKGISLADIYGKLNMERGYFDGRRRSVNEFKRRELAKLVMGAFSEYFSDTYTVEEPQLNTSYGDNYKDEYIESLKARIKDMETDRDFLRRIILEKLDLLIDR